MESAVRRPVAAYYHAHCHGVDGTVETVRITLQLPDKDRQYFFPGFFQVDHQLESIMRISGGTPVIFPEQRDDGLQVQGVQGVAGPDLFSLVGHQQSIAVEIYIGFYGKSLLLISPVERPRM